MALTEPSSSSYDTFPAVLAARTADRPDAPVYVFLADGEAQEQTLTHAQLLREARAIAATLQETRLAGERALLLFPPGLEFISALFGCWLAGVVAVPSNPPRASGARGSNRLASILGDAKPAVVLTVARLAETVTECLVGHDVPCLRTDEVDDATATRWRDPGARATDLACLQYTSGSTSAPKGVMLSHENLMHNGAVICDAFGNQADETGVIWLPAYHDMGLGGILQALYAGGRVVLMAPTAFLQKPIRWLRAISKYGAATSGGPNFAYDLCARSVTEQERATLDLSGWRVAFNGAEPIDGATLDRFAATFAPCGFRREAFYPCYGLAESTLMVSGGARNRGPVGGTMPDQTANAGAPLVGSGHARPDGTILVVDPDRRTPCPPGGIGEIWVRNPSVAEGYWNRPEQTLETFGARVADTSEGPFLRTGDLGFLKGGELFVTGRRKDLIIIRGVNHYPHDIERTAGAAHPALRPAGGAAFAVSVSGQERLVVLHEVERSKRDADLAPVIAAIRQAVVEQHEIDPHAIALLKPGQVPRTSSGKTQRFACRDAFLAGTFETVAEWRAPEPAAACVPGLAGDPGDVAAAEGLLTQPALEAWMTSRLAASLGIAPEEIDPTEPFARYGLDSAKALALGSDIAAHLGREVPNTLFFDYPSVAELAEYLAEQAAAETPGAPQVRTADAA